MIIKTGYQPHAFQYGMHKSIKRFNVFVCHRRFGKTIFAVNELIDKALAADVWLPRFGYIAPQRAQAKRVTWEKLKWYVKDIPDDMKHISEQELYIEFKHNNARITLYGADKGNAENIRGEYFDGVVLDEMADIGPEVWHKIVRPMLTDRRGWALFIGTPKGVNIFYELYLKGGRDKNWASFIYPATKTVNVLPWITEEELADARNDMTDESYRQEYLCDFNASCANVLITIDLITAARGKILSPDQFNFAPLVFGQDVARFGDDRSSLIRRRGLQMFNPSVWKQFDNMQVATSLINKMDSDNPDAVFVDGGRGEGVIDYIRSTGRKVIEINFGGKSPDPHYLNMRSYMWDQLRKWLEMGGALPDDPEIVKDLVVPTFEFDSGGRMVLESKKKMKERVGYSPDLGDAAALTFAMPVKKRLHGIEAVAERNRKKRSRDNYDPLGRRR